MKLRPPDIELLQHNEALLASPAERPCLQEQAAAEYAAEQAAGKLLPDLYSRDYMLPRVLTTFVFSGRDNGPRTVTDRWKVVHRENGRSVSTVGADLRADEVAVFLTIIAEMCEHGRHPILVIERPLDFVEQKLGWDRHAYSVERLHTSLTRLLISGVRIQDRSQFLELNLVSSVEGNDIGALRVVLPTKLVSAFREAARRKSMAYIPRRKFDETVGSLAKLLLVRVSHIRDCAALSLDRLRSESLLAHLPATEFNRKLRRAVEQLIASGVLDAATTVDGRSGVLTIVKATPAAEVAT